MSAFRITGALGVALVLLALAMLLPAAVAAGTGQSALAINFLMAAGLTGFVGAVAALTGRGSSQPFGDGEGLVVFVLFWLVPAPFAALPLYASGRLADPLPALFNALSALTTTGATVGFDPAREPLAIVLWLFILGWLGGFASIVAAVALLTRLDLSGLQMLHVGIRRGEGESLAQSLGGIARRLSSVYSGLTAVGAIALSAAGLPGHQAVLAALGAVSTSGLPFRPEGTMFTIGPAAELALTLCMLAGASNLTMLAAVAAGRWRPMASDRELRYLLLACLLVALAIAFLLRLDGAAVPQAVLAGLFLAVSTLSSTGYGPASAAGALVAAPVLLIGVVLIGGTAGSASGGFKLLRTAILCKQANRELSRLAFPHGVIPFHLGSRRIFEPTVRSVWTLFYVMLSCLVAGSLALAALGVSPVTALLAVVACLSNTGPMLSMLEPAGEGYAALPHSGKLLLMLAMVLGRVEMLAFITALSPAFWRQ